MKMKSSVILFVAAIVLTIEGSVFRFIGDNGNGIGMKRFPPCVPDSCVVRNGNLCKCDNTGNINCHHEDSSDGNGYCGCEPGHVLPSDAPCVCPVKGFVSHDDCPGSFAPDVRRYTVRNMKGTNLRQAIAYAAKPCGYWRCTPPNSARVCVWIKCRH